MSNPTPRDASLRASDDDRIQAAQLLSEAASQGRLKLDDYESRLATWENWQPVAASAQGAPQ